jgi:hypothetical protein
MVAEQETKAVRPHKPSPALKTMPVVTGLTLRSGYRMLGQINVSIISEGSGVIKTQYPPAGTDLSTVDKIVLRGTL